MSKSNVAALLFYMRDVLLTEIGLDSPNQITVHWLHVIEIVLALLNILIG